MQNTNEKASKKPTELERVKAVQLYREGIDELLRLKINQEISNGLPEHAAVLFEQFFKHAKDRVVIFCENLCAVVFDDSAVVAAANQAYDRGVKIEVLIQDEKPASSNFLKFINDKSISFSRVAAPFQKVSYNYSVMDDRAFRFEPDRGDIRARANMNDNKNAISLLNHFESMKMHSKLAPA